MTKVAQKSINYHAQNKTTGSIIWTIPRNLHVCSHQGSGDHRKKKPLTRKQTQVS